MWYMLDVSLTNTNDGLGYFFLDIPKFLISNLIQLYEWFTIFYYDAKTL